MTDSTRVPMRAPAGTIDRAEHDEIHAASIAYGAKLVDVDPDADTIAARGGFTYAYATAMLGHQPRTYQPHDDRVAESLNTIGADGAPQ